MAVAGVVRLAFATSWEGQICREYISLRSEASFEDDHHDFGEYCGHLANRMVQVYLQVDWSSLLDQGTTKIGIAKKPR